VCPHDKALETHGKDFVVRNGPIHTTNAGTWQLEVSKKNFVVCLFFVHMANLFVVCFRHTVGDSGGRRQTAWRWLYRAHNKHFAKKTKKSSQTPAVHRRSLPAITTSPAFFLALWWRRAPHRGVDASVPPSEARRSPPPSQGHRLW
jgi:hypothetical protein